jgi:uncharacterized membrane protein
MKKKDFLNVALCFAICLLSISIISASNSSIQFNQIGNKLSVLENNNGINNTHLDTVGLEKATNGYYFVKKINFSQSYDSVEVKLILDKGFIIKINEAYPTNYEIESNGENIELIWKFYNVTSKEAIAFFVKIEDTSINFNLLGGFVAIVLLACIIYFSFWLYSKRKNNFEEHLMPSEKKVIALLKKADKNEVWQKELLLKTEFSKAKLSRVIRDLEARDLIKKIPYGNTNKISLN